MGCFQKLSLRLLLLLFFPILFCFRTANVEAQAVDLIKEKAQNNNVSAIFVFGDSTVDPGNNNYMKTVFKSNFLPYGRDYQNHMPTGRFSNGRLTTDFISIKEYLPPYLDPTLSIEELMTGVSFASAGSGFDPLTPTLSNVMPMWKQIEYFKEYKTRLELAFGKKRVEDHIKKAVFLVSAGTNDFIVNYFAVPIRRKTYNISTYQQFLMQHVKHFIQDLWEEGAQKIAMVGLPPMGCLPAVITLNSNKAFSSQRGCVLNFCSAATDYNQMLQFQLKSMHNTLPNLGPKIYYIDIYNPFDSLIQSHENFGFDDVSSGCCGTGYIEAALLCNPNSYLCPDASKYVFWDSVHPTEKAYSEIFKAVRSVIDFIIMD